MADYDIGSVGGISVGGSHTGGENMFWRDRDAGDVDNSVIATGDVTPQPLEPVRNAGALLGMSFLNPSTVVISGAVVRTTPRLVRIRGSHG